MSLQTNHRPVLVVDFGAQYAQLIARRVREAGIYSEVIPHTATADDVRAKNAAALVLSGGPSSVYAEGAPSLDAEILDLGLPVFGICYGFQAMTHALGGTVANTGKREYGRTDINVAGGVLHEGLEACHKVWMSHGDAVSEAPEGFVVTASSEGAPVAAFENKERKMAGVQYHPEVLHSPHGQAVLTRFLTEIAGLEQNWTAANIAEELIEKVREQIGEDGRAICGLSGGVDSAVAGALVQRAIGDRLTCVFVDHGLLRAGEREQVEKDFVAATGAKLVTVDERQAFLSKLAGVTEPEAKRKAIGAEFIRSFERAVAGVLEEAPEGSTVDFLVQGTLYPDVVESGGGSGTANIKSHHNVGGLPDDVEFKLVEPLRDLFKDEVRAVGRELGLPEEIVGRQPFPGPGLGIRIIGEVTEDRLETLRHADLIARTELTEAGLDGVIWQCPVVLLADVRSVGVQGDGRTYGHPIVLRPVSSEDAMTADWTRLPYEVLEKISTRITNEVPDVNRVVLDVTSKPPGTIEWE
ncbi:putative GMP synthase [Corynebacterium glutamicum MB001]|uniref:GMP synthase [glutamine-hydrolyzing] n=1 Tax=Corynebacterium glutamicum (strain ATCC 13032 / DSM 20300 / JCM 1318 / BCRC 11384 / CCUG 27702 / LMG 3730 / NBRC 12168 / NCIMB 10025 / NRRL B-2784 / 534) TaxID=196627 RepID=GUAA_CORGL|nr:glutamine-hydrolyzing GMP synthase [Corynebacterium glutamicum]Q8NSR1.1 RecName: Full=GMP synthase [glutamine-hydrolyzing]; AltName: Full=GMP synthetase; AltName: Full=Glutamine amidotransferase [Corynebacterium glutamicum ATCC 13032]AGT04603.1 putative GMP synthase [Corynebacterium glutamicum MB001]AIK84343.1 GMP synthase [Corynebacterium glutamicum]AIK87128.1 GMP synthase [Corynebacterium glutamicum]AJE66645.1 GMP synthase [Corynebacterium glutamicum]ARV65182.1 GMP synthase (glutamine-hy